jgi:hypothetical protein
MFPAGRGLFLYHAWKNILPLAVRHLSDADMAIITSYYPDAIAAAGVLTGGSQNTVPPQHPQCYCSERLNVTPTHHRALEREATLSNVFTRPADGSSFVALRGHRFQRSI